MNAIASYNLIYTAAYGTPAAKSAGYARRLSKEIECATYAGKQTGFNNLAVIDAFRDLDSVRMSVDAEVDNRIYHDSRR